MGLELGSFLRQMRSWAVRAPWCFISYNVSGNRLALQACEDEINGENLR